MKVTYDKEADALYIQFKNDVVAESDENKNGEMIIDYAEDGSVVGIEMLNASQKITQPIQIDYEVS